MRAVSRAAHVAGAVAWNGAIVGVAIVGAQARALAQPAASGGGGGGGGGDRWEENAASAATPDTPSWLWLVLGALLVAVVVALVMRARRTAPSSATARTNAVGVSTFALRAVAGTLTWLGALAAILGVVAGAGIVIAGLAADHGALGLLGAAFPAIGGGLAGMLVMATGQLLACIAAIEAHARVIAKHASENAEETARLRAAVIGRFPPPASESAPSDPIQAGVRAEIVEPTTEARS